MRPYAPQLDRALKQIALVDPADAHSALSTCVAETVGFASAPQLRRRSLHHRS
jgi:hypothetical protein